MSLLPNLGKIFEIAINKSLVRSTNQNKVIPYEQFGFRAKSSMIHTISKFTAVISEALCENKFVAACLIDVEKAFDSVWLDGLIFKMLKKLVPEHLIRVIWSLIKRRKLYVSLSDRANSATYVLTDGL